MVVTTNFINGVPLHGTLHWAVIGSVCSSEGRGRHWSYSQSETIGRPYIEGCPMTVVGGTCRPGVNGPVALRGWHGDGYGVPANIFWGDEE